LRIEGITNTNEDKPERERNPKMFRDIVSDNTGEILSEDFSDVVQEVHGAGALRESLAEPFKIFRLRGL
jgi:hypothetical protein